MASRNSALPALVWLLVLLVGCTGSPPGPPETAATPAAETGPDTTWPTSGWPTSAPAAQGMDGDTLSRIDMLVQERFREVRGVLVVRHGSIVFEHYYHGYDASHYHEIASVTKSFVSALIGAALQDNLLSLDQPIISFFPDYVNEDTDPRKREISIRHLLSLTSGWDWNPQKYPDLGERLSQAPDQRRVMFDLPLAHEPGTVFAYQPVDSHLLSAIITTASGKPTLEYASERLFQPLGIPTDEAAGFAWEQDRQGYAMGPSGLWLTTHDMAKLGYLYLHKGLWDGQQLVSADYIAQATRTQSAGDWSATGEVTYGYHWWVSEHNGHAAFFAAGYGGQFIYVIPDHDLVVVIVSSLKRSAKETRDLIDLAILPAIEEE